MNYMSTFYYKYNLTLKLANTNVMRKLITQLDGIYFNNSTNPSLKWVMLSAHDTNLRKPLMTLRHYILDLLLAFYLILFLLRFLLLLVFMGRSSVAALRISVFAPEPLNAHI